MDKNFFKKLRILDGGMGQELHARGLVSKGTLWSTSAILDEKYHQSVVDIHLDYIEAGAELITTTNFSSRRIRMEQNKVNDMFEFANKKACELALKAKEQSKKEIIIAGSIPAQSDTYREDIRSSEIIHQNFYDQINCIKDFIDVFYLDVISSGREISIATEILDHEAAANDRREADGGPERHDGVVVPDLLDVALVERGRDRDLAPVLHSILPTLRKAHAERAILISRVAALGGGVGGCGRLRW